MYKYTDKSYLKEAFINNHDIYNETQTKLAYTCIKMK